MRELSEQEHFWRGEFGDQYVGRNQGQALVAANLALFAKALARTTRLENLLELGTNTGNNLQALHQLLPGCQLQGWKSTPRPASRPTRWASPRSGTARCSITRASVAST